MKTTDFLRQHAACLDGAHWAMSVSNDMADVWDALIEQGKYEWLVWTATRPGVFSDSELRKLACRFVHETPLLDGRKVWDLLTDERGRMAIVVAERYEDGKAAKKELADARNAARAAEAAAYGSAYAAYAAAYISARAAARAARSAYNAAYNAVNAAADDATYGAYAAAYTAADAAQVKMIAELGNPFKEKP